ncbi:MAG: DUF4249 domain-containing protein [Lentimicrobium sp.]|nr:DUF4249 domain-containing protein [Lentimicrobium sp.]
MKNLKNPFLFILSLIMLILSGCDSMISDVEVPDSDPKLVVTGFLSPADDTISIVVSKSRPLYEPTQGGENPFPVVNNAIVIISDGINSITLPFNPLNGAYQTLSEGFPIQPGSNYSLSVTTPDGYNATADCTIPEGIAPDIEITGIDTINEYGTVSKRVSFRFRDLPGQGQFYRIAAGTFYGEDYSYTYFNETGFERGEPFVSDKNREEEYFLFKTWDIYEDNSPGNTLYVSISITDQNYFNYHKSVNSFEGDNPFSEPTPVFSNITGGLGIFAGLNGKITQHSLEDPR